MALEFAKELLGDAYTGELEEKLNRNKDAMPNIWS